MALKQLKRFAVLCFVLMLTPLTQAQKLTQIQTTTIRNVIEDHLGPEANNRVIESGKHSFLTIGKNTYFNIHGLRYIFLLKGDSAIRLDKSFYHGSTFFRYLIQYDAKIMSLGGYGMFVTNNNLETFNTETQEWYLLQTYGDVPKAIKGCCIRIKNSIYLFNNARIGNNLSNNTIDPYFYQLDLTTMTWKKYKEFRTEFQNTFIGDYFYTQDFVIGKGDNNSVIYNVKTQQFIFSNNDALGLKFFNGANTTVDNNTLFLISEDSLITGIQPEKYNLEALWKKNESLAQNLILNPTMFQQYPLEISAVGGALALAFLLTFIITRHAKNKQTRRQSNPFIKKLIHQEKSELSIEELDTLLQINHMETESKKTKRHRMLTQIENDAPGLVVREKDSTDKRRFIYLINKSFGI